MPKPRRLNRKKLPQHRKRRKRRHSPLRIPRWRRRTPLPCCWRRPRSWPRRTRRLRSGRRAGTAQNDTTSQHTPEDSVLLTPEQIQQALDSGALEDAEAQCIDLTDENGFFRWLFNWLFGSKDKEEEPAPAYSGWRTENGKTYYYAQDTKKKSPACAPLTASCIISMPTALNRTT